MNQGHPLDEYYLVADSQLPNEDLMIGGGLFADSLQDCAILCERQNSILSGSYHDDGAISTGYPPNMRIASFGIKTESFVT